MISPPAYVLARVEVRPTRCVCCRAPFAAAGPQAQRQVLILTRTAVVAWCRRCDPWRDAALAPHGQVYGPIRTSPTGDCLHPGAP